MVKSKLFVVPIVLGVLMVILGWFTKVPGGLLTTEKEYDGGTSDAGVFDDRVSAIDEYFKGDLQNYIIGAELVSGDRTGVIVKKALFVVGGLLCICIGLLMRVLSEGIIVFDKSKSIAQQKDDFKLYDLKSEGSVFKDNER